VIGPARTGVGLACGTRDGAALEGAGAGTGTAEGAGLGVTGAGRVVPHPASSAAATNPATVRVRDRAAIYGPQVPGSDAYTTRAMSGTFPFASSCPAHASVIADR
jgi:hypothetical protein